MSENLKDAEHTSYAEFEKWWEKNGGGLYVRIDSQIAWNAALKWIYYAGVLDYSLAGDLIKGELPDGSI